MFKSDMGDHPPSSMPRRRLIVAAVAGAFGWTALPAIAQMPGGTPPTDRTAGEIERRGTVLELQESAPDRYTVQRGDTLWGIAIRFLKEPWRWPEFWRFNNEQIRNPHLIFPGQVLVLDRFGRRLTTDDRVQPRVRVERGPGDAIPSIPANVIEPWLTRPLVIEPGALDNAPRIVATEEGRYNLGPGGRAYVRGIPADNKERAWQIYRQGRPLVDPETKETLGIEAVYVGSARLMRAGDAAKNEPATFIVDRAQIEVTQGDRLVPAEPARLIQYVPRAPERDMSGRVIAIYGGRGDDGSMFLGRQPGENRKDSDAYEARREAGPLQIVSLNRGTKDGIEIGHVLSLHRSTYLPNDRSIGAYLMGSPRPEPVQLPEERYGLVFVFRTFERVSYALIVQGQRTVVPGDVARRP
jgi:hypothetical protein